MRNDSPAPPRILARGQLGVRSMIVAQSSPGAGRELYWTVDPDGGQGRVVRRSLDPL